MNASVPRVIYSLALAALLGVTIGCALFNSSEMRKDSWYTGVPQDIADLPGWSLLESGRLHVVTGSMGSRAQRVLEANSFVEITSDKASEFIGYAPNTVPGTRFYLVRSVLANEKTGGYYISILNGNLWVHHASLGREPVTVKRRALVLQLSETPEQVYVTYSIAE